MAYERKTIDTWELQLNYGYGWEEVTCEETRKEGLARLRDYRTNDPQHAYKLVCKRIKIERAE